MRSDLEYALLLQLLTKVGQAVQLNGARHEAGATLRRCKSLLWMKHVDPYATDAAITLNRRYEYI
jgi:hypothetical protein